MTQSTTASAPANGAPTAAPADSASPVPPLDHLEPETRQALQAVRPAPLRRLVFTDEQRAAIMRQCCTNTERPEESANVDELADFIATCERLQLDPMARQVHFLKRGKPGHKKGRAEVSIDGLRLIAERTGDYQGQTPREWCHAKETGNGMSLTWYEVWPFPTAKVPPLAARVGVYRRGFQEPLYAVARFEAYKQTKYGGELNEMWSKMGPEQLGKCAEALALRQAFPNELAGVYTTDEMGQADEPEPPQQPQRQQQRQQQRRPAATGGTQDRARSSARATPTQPATTRVWHPLAFKPGDTISGAPPALFPYGKFENVALYATWPDQHEATPAGQEGQYVIPTAKLEAAQVQLSNRLKFLKGRPERDTEEEDQVVTWLNQLADELERRAATAATPYAPPGGEREPAGPVALEGDVSPGAQGPDTLPGGGSQ